MSEKILVMITTSRSNNAAVKFASDMAKANNSELTALYVESTHDIKYSEDEKQALEENIKYAKNIGASVVTVYGTDIPKQIAQYAFLSEITKVVLPKLNEPALTKIFRRTIAERLSKLLPSAEICIIPSGEHFSDSIVKNLKSSNTKNIDLSDILKATAILSLTTIFGRFLIKAGIDEHNMISMYILAVMVTAMTSKSRITSILSAAFSVLLFNIFFIEPYFSLKTDNVNYPVTFLIMLIVGILISMLSAKVRIQAQNATEKAYITELFFEASRSFADAADFDEIIDKTAVKLEKMLKKTVIFYIPDAKGILTPKLTYNGTKKQIDSLYLSNDEQSIASWVARNNKRAGSGTDTFINSPCLYLAVQGKPSAYAVASIIMNREKLSSFENDIVIALLSECSLAIEKYILRKQKHDAEMKAQKKELQSTMLRAISHDLRTPLTGISGNAHLLITEDDKLNKQKKTDLYYDIYDDAIWLHTLVENLLSSSRITDGNLNVLMSVEMISEVLEEALKHISRQKKFYDIQIIEKDELLLSAMDSRLIIQVFVNIIDNAIKYSPRGSSIKIKLSKKDDKALICICDSGCGIPDDDKSKIFDMFYSGHNASSDSRRGMGLGLYLCKSIVNLHGGEIGVYDNKPKGTIVYFTLPIEEVSLNE